MSSSPDRFDELVREYAGLIRRVVTRVTGRQAGRLRDDVEQEVLTALWKRMKSEQTIERPASYVFMVARSEAIRALKREAARLSADPPEGWERLPATGGDPGVTLEMRELGSRIDAALARLTPDRERAMRAHLMGFDAQEIMRLTGWPYNKTRNLIVRGMADLRSRLQEEVGDDR